MSFTVPFFFFYFLNQLLKNTYNQGTKLTGTAWLYIRTTSFTKCFLPIKSNCGLVLICVSTCFKSFYLKAITYMAKRSSPNFASTIKQI